MALSFGLSYPLIKVLPSQVDHRSLASFRVTVSNWRQLRAAKNPRSTANSIPLLRPEDGHLPAKEKDQSPAQQAKDQSPSQADNDCARAKARAFTL